MATVSSAPAERRRPPKPLADLVARLDLNEFDAPGGRTRIRLALPAKGAWDVVVADGTKRLERADEAPPDSLLEADLDTWSRVSTDLEGGMRAFRQGRLSIRRNLHLAVAFLSAASTSTDPARLRSICVRTRNGRISTLQAGSGEPILLLHGLGATKGSFLATLAALATTHRTIAVDLPGFGDSGKPLGAPYDAPFFARSMVDLLDALGIDRAHILGHSMGGRVALELGFCHPDRTAGLVLMTPSLAWLRKRSWAPYLKLLRPELGLFQLAPRRAVEMIVRRTVPGAGLPWVDIALDEFIRSYVEPRGRAAFYAAARQIYLEEPQGEDGFWPRLRALAPESLFVWGRYDEVVPIGFARHVRDALPGARHLELDCAHVPQMERPDELHSAVRSFLSEVSGAAVVAPAAMPPAPAA